MHSARIRSQFRHPLWHFHGGLHIPDEKTLSRNACIQEAKLPEQLIIPLQQHIGAAAKPLVQVGEQVYKGQKIAEAQGYVSAPVHASSSGTVVAIEKHPIPHPSGLSAPCIRIETDGKDAWGERPPELLDYRNLEPAEIRARIRWAGIVGMGGAAFPTSVKLNPGSDQNIHTLIVNGAECEPYITCDDRLMREQAGRILQGVRILRHLLAVKTCLIGVEDNKPEALEALRLALAESDLKGDTKIVSIPTLYPSGGEKQLIKILTGKEVPSHGIPAQIGIVCQNVGTVAAIADAVLESKPLISRIVTLTGRGMAQPQNFSVRIGTPFSDLLEQAGGLSSETAKLIIGGPMMGFLIQDPQIPVTKATNCLLALTAAESPEPDPPRPCIRCGACTEACPMNLLPQQMYWYARAKDLDKVQDYHLFDCIECGCCALVCPSHIPLVHYYRYAKAESWAREQEKRKAEHARRRHEAKEARLARLEAERKAKLRKKKAALAKKGTGQAEDPKKAAIEAAKRRAAEKKAALAKQGVVPKNTQELNPAQQQQIEAAEARRRQAKSEIRSEKD